MTSRIVSNLEQVRQCMAAAAERSGRLPRDIRLVAVTKYVSTEPLAELIEAGCRDFGESRPQELWRKAEALAGAPVRWHLVGHLQRNKVQRTLPLVALIHSVDSLSLLQEIDKSARGGRRVPVLLEVNVSGEAAKHGAQPDEVEPLLIAAGECPMVEVRGLMTMASLAADAPTARRQFSRLRELRDRLRRQAPPAASLDELSMGMSRDYELAIEEGATIVRVGSALFEGLDK